MSSPKLNLPLLSDFLLGEVMSSHDGVYCYPAIRRGTEDKYILKVISVPASPSKMDALLLTGAMPNKEAALSYFMTLSEDVLRQTDILRQLSQQEGFVPYLDGQIVPMDSGSGYEVYLLGTYKQSLERTLRTDVMTHADVANLGLDLCAALAACRRTGYLYVDLKPGNIFRDPNQGFRIGDVGFIALSSLKYASLPDKYRSSYTAPELADDMAVLNPTVDIYALGLVLYQAYNGGVLPYMDAASEEVLPPPIYADYEMAEIILKACHPDPKQRWQEPTKMAHALIEYLQTYGAPETPIIPPVLEKPQEDEVEEEPFLPEADPEQLQQEIADLENADPDELAFLSGLVSDETAPSEENTADVPDEVMTEELTEIFAQADELISHELPEPPVAPEPVFAPMPEPIVLEDETEAHSEEEEETDWVVSFQPEDDVAPAAEEASCEEPSAEAEEEAAAPPPEEKPIDPEAIPLEEKPLLRRVIAAAIVVLLLIGGWFFGQKFYNDYYLLAVDGLVLNWEKDTVTVQIRSDIDEQLLSVICTDTYGNSTTSAVTNGIATFTKLNPNTRYTVRVEVSGFHKLTGATTDSFTTAAETQIHSFTAGIGPDDCSVSLNFTVSGPTNGKWTVLYSADGIAQKAVDFTGRSVVVNDLVPGALYTFTLTSSDVLYLSGQTQVQYLATKILYAKNLSITACVGGSLTAVWEQPDDGTVTEWQVRCFNESGYNETITTTDLSYTFTNVDHSTACTVEVTAVGMDRSVSTSISANPITMESFTCEFTEALSLQVTWAYSAQSPVTNWVLRYSINGSKELVLPLEDAFANILAVPGATYSFTIETAEGNFVFNGNYSYVAEDVPTFSGYGVTSSDMNWSMFLWPDGNKWDHNDIPAENFKNEFTLDQQAGFLISLGAKTEKFRNNVNIQFVVHDAQGNLVQQYSSSSTWSDLWRDDRCLLPIPALADAPGDYTLTVYFDGGFVYLQEYTMHEIPTEDGTQAEEPAI